MNNNKEKSNEENEEEVWINCKAYRVDGVLNHLVSGAPIYIYEYLII